MFSSTTELLKPSGHVIRNQFIAAVTGSLFAISDGMNYGWASPMIPYLTSDKSHIKTTKQEAEWLETVQLCGSFAGLPLTIYAVDKIGRKKSLLLASFIMLIGWLFMGFGNHIAYIFIGRFLCGMADDMACVSCPMYIAEISDKKIRGFLSMTTMIMLHIGILLVYCLGSSTSYYVVPVTACTFVVIELIVFCFIPESPIYLLSKKKENQARAALEFFKPQSDIDKEVQDITRMLENDSGRGRLLDLFLVRSHRKSVAIMLVLNTGLYVCGYIAILMNLELILKSAGFYFIGPSLATTIFASIMLLAVIIGSICVDKFGRKLLLIISSFLSGLCLLSIAVYFHLKYVNFNLAGVTWIPLASVVVFAAVYKSGAGMIPILITSEIFPSELKAVGMTLGDATYIIGGIIALQIYHSLSRTVDIFAPFYIFSAYAFFLSIFTFFFVPETKGRSLHEIQRILKGEINY